MTDARERLRETLFNALWRCDFAENEDPAIIEKMKVEWPDDVVSVQKRADAALAAIEAAGVRLVPSEATHKMADVGTEARWQSAVRDANNVREIYRAMLAASPYAPQKEQTHESD